MTEAQFLVFQGEVSPATRHPEFYWHLEDESGRIVCTGGQGYVSEEGAVADIDRVKELVGNAVPTRWVREIREITMQVVMTK